MTITWPNLESQTKNDLAEVVGKILLVLYADEAGDPDMDSPWDSETIDHVAAVLRDAGLEPGAFAPPPPRVLRCVSCGTDVDGLCWVCRRVDHDAKHQHDQED